MGVFSLDIERLYRDFEDSGQKLKGIFCIQYPIYCIHATINDVTPDALDNLDKVIIDFFIKRPTFTSFQISCLMGTSKSLVEFRIDKLISDGLLERSGEFHNVTQSGVDVFAKKTSTRLHKRSYDFYLDGVSLRPLPKIFYTYYRTKFINESQTNVRTNRISGETYITRPFGPDIVHTPPNKQVIFANVLGISGNERDNHSIPNGLESIDDISFSKLSIQMLVSVTETNKLIKKELIDGFAIYSLRDNISYYESVKRNIRIFEDELKSRIDKLEFKIIIPKQKESNSSTARPSITSNWHEVDKYDNSTNRCFSFSSEDLVKLMEHLFGLVHVEAENLVNTERSIEINVTKRMLLESSNRLKVIGALIRKRDYKMFTAENSLEKNVFLLYLYYNTNDEFVREVLRFRQILDTIPDYQKKINCNWLESNLVGFKWDQRELLSAAGEFEILERVDIEKHMVSLI